MRSMLTIYPIRRTSVPPLRARKPTDSFSKMLRKLDAAGDRLAKARRKR